MKGQSTIGTYLSIGEPPEDISFPIKAYPDIGGSPDLIEVTDQDDESRKNVPGVKSSEALEFLMNYTDDDFWNLSDICENGEADLYFELKFGANGEHGKFQWTGRAYVRINGGDVNSAREMTLSVYPDGGINDATELPEPEFSIAANNLILPLESGSQMINIEANWETGAEWVGFDPDIVSVEPIGNGKVAIITPITGGNTAVYAHPNVPSYDPDFVIMDPYCSIMVPYLTFDKASATVKKGAQHTAVFTIQTNLPVEFTEDDWEMPYTRVGSFSFTEEGNYTSVTFKAGMYTGSTDLVVTKDYNGIHYRAKATIKVTN